MHYYIDGYNLLFRLIHSPKDLQSERADLLVDLNQKASLLGLDISIVFDAIHQAGGSTRGHFNVLEVIYTAAGETADAYIIDAISRISSPRTQIVVTNDKTLAFHVRHFSVKVETIEGFTQWLNRSYANRLKQSKNIKKKPPPLILPSLPLPPKIEINAPPEEKGTFDYYQRVFEADFQLIQEEAKQHKAIKHSLKKVKTPKSRKDPFASPSPPSEKEKNEMERWLKAFEDRLNHPPKE